MSVAQKRHANATVQEGSIMERCQALDLARSSFYYQRKGERVELGIDAFDG
ncbi:MAG: hypothetical protein IPO60_10490 [Flavobacteriales bacterium]|nr:hypothetical protein [Flavobacteriales bacterium]